jgi:hypothetical protein
VTTAEAKAVSIFLLEYLLNSADLPMGLTSRDNDHYKQKNDADNQTHTHLHVFPPHLLSHAVGASAEALR